MARRPSFALPFRRSIETEPTPIATPACPAPVPHTDAPAHAPQLEKLLRKEEVMEVLGISESTLRRLVRKGQLPSVKFDGAVRFRASDVHAFVLRKLTKR